MELRLNLKHFPDRFILVDELRVKSEMTSLMSIWCSCVHNETDYVCISDLLSDKKS